MAIVWEVYCGIYLVNRFYNVKSAIVIGVVGNKGNLKLAVYQ